MDRLQERLNLCLLRVFAEEVEQLFAFGVDRLQRCAQLSQNNRSPLKEMVKRYVKVGGWRSAAVRHCILLSQFVFFVHYLLRNRCLLFTQSNLCHYLAISLIFLPTSSSLSLSHFPFTFTSSHISFPLSPFLFLSLAFSLSLL